MELTDLENLIRSRRSIRSWREMTSPMQAKEEIEKILRVPSEMDIIAFIPVGYPAENPAPGKRKPIGEVCNVIG